MTILVVYAKPEPYDHDSYRIRFTMIAKAESINMVSKITTVYVHGRLTPEADPITCFGRQCEQFAGSSDIRIVTAKISDQYNLGMF